jgi:hypothetical protein
VDVVVEDARLVVLDGFLADNDARSLWHDVQRADYVPVHSGMADTNKVWRLQDGAPLKGLAVARSLSEMADGRGDAHPLRTLLATIAGAAPRFHACIGRAGGQWTGIKAQAMLYPVGAALSWHSDGVQRSGAFIYFAHPAWNVQWGGELLVSDIAPFAVSHAYDGSQDAPPWLENGLENRLLLESGTGRFVMPKPNRLVLVASGVHHAIAPVRSAAGDHVRATVSGFFERTLPERGLSA